MFATNKGDFAALLLRITLGLIFLTHGLIKFFILTSAGNESYFSIFSFSPMFGYILVIIELITGIFLLSGLFTRVFSLIAIIDMAGVTYAHFNNGFIFSNQGGGWEYPAFMIIIGLASFILGSGRYSLPICRKKLGKY